MEQSLFIELIKRTKGILDTIRKLTELSRGKFSDREFEEFFHKAITKDIEKHHLLIDTFLKYIESTTPIAKRDTVNKLIEEGIKKHQVRLEEKKIAILRKLEQDLPETTLPDEHLRFIFDSLLQHAMALMGFGGYIEFLSKSVVLPGTGNEDKEFLKGHGKYIEIVMVLNKLMEQPAKGLETRSPKEEVLSDLVYRLVDRIVRRNEGTIRFEVDGSESKNAILLRFPVERRKVVYYQRTISHG